MMRRSRLPAESSLAPLFATADLADAYAAPLPQAVASLSIDELAARLLGNPSWWFKALLGIRDGVMGRLGVKTTAEMRRAEGRGRVDFFPILARRTDELILGEDDRHLDFRASILRRSEPSGRGQEIVMTTVVHCHNLLGRTYLRAILPFHKVVVTSSLRRAARSGWQSSRTHGQ